MSPHRCISPSPSCPIVSPRDQEVTHAQQSPTLSDCCGIAVPLLYKRARSFSENGLLAKGGPERGDGEERTGEGESGSLLTTPSSHCSFWTHPALPTVFNSAPPKLTEPESRSQWAQVRGPSHLTLKQNKTPETVLRTKGPIYLTKDVEKTSHVLFYIFSVFFSP